jgi:hypothetical protein
LFSNHFQYARATSCWTGRGPCQGTLRLSSMPKENVRISLQVLWVFHASFPVRLSCYRCYLGQFPAICCRWFAFSTFLSVLNAAISGQFSLPFAVGTCFPYSA